MPPCGIIMKSNLQRSYPGSKLKGGWHGQTRLSLRNQAESRKTFVGFRTSTQLTARRKKVKSPIDLWWHSWSPYIVLAVDDFPQVKVFFHPLHNNAGRAVATEAEFGTDYR